MYIKYIYSYLMKFKLLSPVLSQTFLRKINQILGFSGLLHRDHRQNNYMIKKTTLAQAYWRYSFKITPPPHCSHFMSEYQINYKTTRVETKPKRNESVFDIFSLNIYLICFTSFLINKMFL